MKHQILYRIILPGLILCSCNDSENRILGCWEARFSDSIVNPVQYLVFTGAANGLRVVSDEPAEDWYGIPGEKVNYSRGRLYFERFWGLETYEGRFLPGDSVISGVKHISLMDPVQFTLRRIPQEKLDFRIPRMDDEGRSIEQYDYRMPVQRNDALVCGNLAEAGMDTARIFDLVNRILDRDIPNIHSLLICKDHKLVLEEYFYNYSIDRPHRIHSVSKSFTSALAGIAIDRNNLPGVEEEVWKYFPDRESTPWVRDRYPIRIKHLLSMSAGLDWNPLALNETSDDMELYKTADYFGYLLNKNLRYKPGTYFCYNNGLSLMVGHIIETSSGMPVDDFCREFLFGDLGITDYSWDIADNGITRTDGGLKMRPRDMLKFGLLYLNDGVWMDKRLISAEWIQASTLPKIQAGEQDYGFHWWIRKARAEQGMVEYYYALGHGEQAIMLVPEIDLAVVMTAGNYLEPEHRPFEIMSEYIL